MTIMRDLPSIHPGEQLREEFMKPLGITSYRLAKDIGVPITAFTCQLSPWLVLPRKLSGQPFRKKRPFPSSPANS
jgi:hypothetical protein